MSTPALIVITGPDGTGKSTLCAGLVARLNRELGPGSAASAQIWASLADLLSRDEAQRYLGAIGHRSRALLLLHAMSRALELAEEGSPRVLVVDGYWYKYAVSEVAHGAPEAAFATCAELFPKPELTLHLDLDLAEAARRKADFTAYERGFSESVDPRAAFVAFQTRLRDRWSALEQEVGPWRHHSSDQDPVTLLDGVWDDVLGILETGSGG